ncbi:MAG TPA: hypothetical protein VLB04_09625 [Methanotrichaceae archaeon]|nr:hypothetical protein [Methanotrichaceae archaeon]
MIASKALSILLLLVLSISPALGASTLPSGLDNPLPLRYPELNRADAPSWLEEGHRATYNALVSTSDTEHGGGIDYGTGSAGNGLEQADLVALEDGQAATYTQTYVPDTLNAWRVAASGGSVAPEGCGEFWCSPDVLKSIPEKADDDLTVRRLPVTVGGKEYQAIRFDFRNENYEMALVYDLDTGVLLYHTFNYSPEFRDAGTLTASRGNYGTYELRNLRKIEIPWKDGDGKVPSWLEQGSTLSMQGQSIIQLQGASPYSSPLEVQLSVLQSEDKFAVLKQETYSQDSAPSQIRTVSGSAQLLGFWVPQEALDLSPGLIDSDPDSGMQICVAESDSGNLIFEKTNGIDYRALFAYDANGRLVEIYQEFNPDASTSSGFSSARVVDLQLVGA